MCLLHPCSIQIHEVWQRAMNFAKSLAFANNIPLVPVDHIKGHVAAAYFASDDLKPPFLALVVSGGHTSIYHIRDYAEFDELNVKSVRITVEVPENQASVGISEVRILGK